MATSQSDKEHQRVMRDLRQQGQAAVTWGLPNPTTEAAILGMALVIRERMAAGAGEDRAAQAAELAAVMLDKTLSKMPQAPAIACAKGCSYCCHVTVAVSAPEVFRIARLLRARADDGPSGKSSIAERARARTAGSMEALVALRTPCPLLVDGDCSIYDMRPLACRQFVSMDAAGCRSAYERGSSDLPFVPGAANAGLILRSVLMGAATSLKLQVALYELSSALNVALAEPDAEARWLAGEDALAKAQRLPFAPNMRSSSERWANLLMALYQ